MPALEEALDAALLPFAVQWDRMTPAALDVVAAQAVSIQLDLLDASPHGDLFCHLACEKWWEAFLQAGICADLVSGVYFGHLGPDDRAAIRDGDLEPPLSCDHVWLQVQGTFFDPTAGQFSSEERPWRADGYLQDGEYLVVADLMAAASHAGFREDT